LKRFPVTALKIDRSFVASLDDEDSADATLVSAIVAMAKALGIATIAEGVETPTQAARLGELGCDHVQGFYYSRPLPAASVVEALEPGRATVGLPTNERGFRIDGLFWEMSRNPPRTLGDIAQQTGRSRRP
jgi:sensor c-di-GMP phosphodiesterase-like protein